MPFYNYDLFVLTPRQTKQNKIYTNFFSLTKTVDLEQLYFVFLTINEKAAFFLPM